ncbi:MAG: hypothetical protein ACLQJR_35545 [Stellaceae bacterium]
MKKRMAQRVAGSLGAVGVGVILGVGQAQAAPDTITLSGAVGQACTLTITASGSYSNLDLTGAQSNVAVGTSVEACNDGKGYKVTIATRNGTSSGILKGTSHGQTLVYGVNYGSTSTLSFAGSTATATTTQGPGFTTITVGVSFGSGASLAHDTYTDTLTFTLRTN